MTTTAKTATERRLQRAAAKSTAARRELEAAVRDARAAGLPLRRIAALAGLSPEWVRRIAAGTAGVATDPAGREMGEPVTPNRIGRDKPDRRRQKGAYPNGTQQH